MDTLLSSDLKEALENLTGVKPVSKDGQNILAPFLEVFKGFLFILQDKFDSFKKDIVETCKAKDNLIDVLRTEIRLQRECKSLLEDKLDNLAQYSRRESLVFSGSTLPAYKEGENCAEEICKLLPAKLGINISGADISIAHRLGSRQTNGIDRRSMIVKFVRRDLRCGILSAARHKKPENFFLNESLTPTRQSITSAIRKAKHEFPEKVSGYTTVDGSVYVWIKPPNPGASRARDSRFEINTLAKFEQFCKKNFGLPAAHFLPVSNRDRPENI